MIEAIKAVLARATLAHRSGEADEAERLFKEAAAEAANKDAVMRAEGLMGVAQSRRDNRDLIGASIYYAEAITLLRNAEATERLAYALRHAGDVRSELGEYAVAGAHTQEAVRLYRSLSPVPTLDLANALRVSALNDEREALASWTEAETLYAQAGVPEGATEAARRRASLASATRKPNPQEASHA